MVIEVNCPDGERFELCGEAEKLLKKYARKKEIPISKALSEVLDMSLEKIKNDPKFRKKFEEACKE